MSRVEIIPEYEEQTRRDICPEKKVDTIQIPGASSKDKIL